MLGRAGELAVITAAAEEVSRRGSAVVIDGEPGIGKTTLLAAAAEWAQTHGFRVLSCAGVQCQSGVGYAGVHELVHPILGFTQALPPHQGAAVRAVFGLADAASSTPMLIGVSLLGLLEEAAAAQPLMLIVDDAQWLDESSLQCLTFVGRRLTSAPILLLCAARSRSDGHSPQLASLPRLR